MSQRGAVWLIGVIAGCLLLGGAEMYFHRPYVPPELKEMEQRADFLSKWKPPLPINSEAPGFSLKDGSGQVHSLAEFRGKPVLLGFYSDDSRSRLWAQEMNRLWDHLGKDKMRSVAVVSFSPEAARAFARETKDGSVYLFEDPENHPVRDRYHAAPGPNAWVLDDNGFIRHASAPITTDRHPDQDFFKVYKALQALTQQRPNMLPGAARAPQPPAHGR